MRGVLLLLFFGLFASGCAEPSAPASAPEAVELVPRPELRTAADSLAWQITEAAGGLAAWTALPRLRYDWAFVRDTVEVFRARHLWDRTSGRYRVEYPVGEDSVLVAAFDARRFDPSVPSGLAAINGIALDSTEARTWLSDAYERYINDSYWLLAPLKLFDPGVRRALAPDSADAATDVLLLTFDGVGLTPGDRYWLRADATGQIVSWAFALEGGGEGYSRWTEVTELPTPAGPLRFATRKAANGRAILTQPLPADALGPEVFSDLQPRL